MLKRDYVPEDEFFYAEQNARLVKDAEEYYCTMFGGRVSSWNLCDRHMAETLDALVAHLEQQWERAIGVIYLPRSERISHYFYARLPEQFDAVLHFDETCAVEPLDRTEQWETGEPPETYPTSF